MPRFAVIDLGTNTFHMLIVEKKEAAIPFRILHRERRFVKLAEEGIATIGQRPFERAIATLVDYQALLQDYKVQQYRACGTAALRTASNGEQFVSEAKRRAQIDIQLIAGQTEAKLIQRGVALTLPPALTRPYVIMDIGGGSVEFILCEGKEVKWARSFPVGAAVLYKQFHHSDPISTSEIAAIHHFLKNTLASFLQMAQDYATLHLVGASGTFDVLGMQMVGMKPTDLYAALPLEEFGPLFQSLRDTTYQERYDRADIPDSRADMLIVALILIDFIIQNVPIEELSVSSFAMKEGILTEMLG